MCVKEVTAIEKATPIFSHTDVMKLNSSLSRGIEEEPRKARPAQLNVHEVPLILSGYHTLNLID